MSLAREVLSDALVAALGGAAATSIAFPLDTIQNRLQAARKKTHDTTEEAHGYSNVFRVLQDMMEAEETVTTPERIRMLMEQLFRGVTVKVLWSVYGKLCYYGCFALGMQLWRRWKGGPRDGTALPVWLALAIGYLSNLGHVPLTMPLEMVATTMQTARAGSAKHTVSGAVKALFKEHGVRGFFRCLPAFMVLNLQPALFNALYFLFSRRSSSLSPQRAFLLGALCRAVSVLLFHPLRRAMIITQASSHSTLRALRILLRSPMCLYKGLLTGLIAATLTSASFFAARERLRPYIRALFLLPVV